MATNYRNSTAYRTSTLDYRGIATGGGTDASITATAVSCTTVVGTVTAAASSEHVATAILGTTVVGTVTVAAGTGTEATVSAIVGLTVMADFNQRHALVVMGGASKQGVWV